MAFFPVKAEAAEPSGPTWETPPLSHCSLWDLTIWKVTGGEPSQGSSANWSQVEKSTWLRLLDETESLLQNLQDLLQALWEPHSLAGRDRSEAITLSPRMRAALDLDHSVWIEKSCRPAEVKAELPEDDAQNSELSVVEDRVKLKRKRSSVLPGGLSRPKLDLDRPPSELDLSKFDFDSGQSPNVRPFVIGANNEEVVLDPEALRERLAANDLKITIFPCQKCGKGFVEQGDQLKHESWCETHRGLNPTFPMRQVKGHKYQCSIDNCGDESAYSFIYMLKHCLAKHVDNPDDLPKFYCHVCSETFPHTRLQSTHIRLKCDKQNVCEECGNRYPNPSKLEEHRLSYHMKAAIFACDSCEAKFKTRNSLFKHKKKLHDVKFTHFCEFCAKGFTREFALTNHVKWAHDPETLAKRARVKPESKRVIKCQDCDYTADMPYKIREHRKNTHDYDTSQVVVCDVCGTSLKTKHSLARHKRNMHPSAGNDVIGDVTRAAKKPWSEARREFHQKTLLRDQRSHEVSLKISKAVTAAHAKAKVKNKGQAEAQGQVSIPPFQDANAQAYNVMS